MCPPSFQLALAQAGLQYHTARQALAGRVGGKGVGWSEFRPVRWTLAKAG